MTTAIVPLEQAPLAGLEVAINRARDYARASRAPRTLEEYRNDWQGFEAWCAAQGLESLPAHVETVAAYLSDLAERCKASTVARRSAAIDWRHKLAGFPPPSKSPAVAAVMDGMRRTKGTAQIRKAPAVAEDVRAMVNTLPDTLLGKRNRALLLLGFAGAFRRSELVGLNVADLEFCEDGVKVMLRKSKTDQQGAGMVKAIPFSAPAQAGYCPVRALRAWLEAAGITEGPIFRPTLRSGQVLPDALSGRAVARLVKDTAAAAGLEPSKYSGHSLRAGLVTTAILAGKSDSTIMRQTGHKKVETLYRYRRDANLFKDNAAGGLL